MKKRVKSILFCIMLITGCSNSPYLVIYLSNINEAKSIVEFTVEVDNTLLFTETITYSDIRPSYKEVFTRLPKGEHVIIFNIEDVSYKMDFFHEDKTFFYASFSDSLGIPKINVIKSEKPFKHQ